MLSQGIKINNSNLIFYSHSLLTTEENDTGPRDEEKKSISNSYEYKQ